VNQNCELDLVRRWEIARSEMVDGCAMMKDEGDRKRKRSEQWEVNKASMGASIGGRSRSVFRALERKSR